VSVLEPLGAVRPDYRHVEKHIRASESLMLDDALLKWYDIAPPDARVPGDVRTLARRNLRAAARSGAIALAPDLGFVILHRCGEDFYFLRVCTWRNDNELWVTVWAKDGDREPEFHPLGGRGDAPPDLLHLGARRGLPRAAGVDPLPLLRPRRGGEARVPAGQLRGSNLTCRPTDPPENLFPTVYRGAPPSI
jgi:hypothetical protein